MKRRCTQCQEEKPATSFSVRRGAVVLVDRCAFCGRLVMAGQTACWRCTEAMRAPWPDDEVTEVGVVPLGLK
jgi:uncharacterized OB-fold protein